MITASIQTIDAGKPNSFRTLEIHIPDRHWQTSHSQGITTVLVYHPTDADLAAIADACRPTITPPNAREIEAPYGR